MSEDYWPTDGTKHHNVNRSSFYTNKKIDIFLDKDLQTLIIAAKGMGKTLLLRAKKKLLEDDHEGTLIIPRNEEYDEPQLHGSYPQSGLEDVPTWTDLWKCSITLSILSHIVNKEDIDKNFYALLNHVNNLSINNSFKNDLINDICDKNEHNPSYYLAEILTKGISGVQTFLKSTHNIDSISIKYIRNSVAVFIDGFDQTLTTHFSHSLEIWRNAQLGLSKAAHRLNTQNRHIKVFASIRQEAYSGFKDDDREVIKGSSLLLEYKRDELLSMLNHAIKKYTNKTSIDSICHLSKIYNKKCEQEEEIFNYIYRHSTASPRSIMYFGKAINDESIDSFDASIIVNKVKEVVNKTGAENIFKDYLLGQRKIFLETLDSEQKIRKLLSLIPANILHSKALESIRNYYAELIGNTVSHIHPFCELFNIGVLGTIRKSTSLDKEIQRFRKPYEFSWIRTGILIEDAIYLIHPSLYDAILDERPSFFLNSTNIVGDEMPWIMPEDDKIFPLLFISHSSIDKDQIEELLSLLDNLVNRFVPLTFWYDKWSIRAGDDIHQVIDKGVEGSDFVLVFISKNSLKSGWVEKEWRKKHYNEIEKKIFR